MNESFDREKVLDCLFDPNNSEILSQLEDGKKDLSELAFKSELTQDAILDKLSYLFEIKILTKSREENKTYLEADHEQLSKIVENDANFDGAVDGLTKMDSYLN